MTAKTKYGSRVHSKDLIKKIPYYGGKSLVAHNGELDADCSLGYHCIAKPMSFDHPHHHDFPEMLCFIGGNPEDVTDLGAEIDFTLGGEKHHINTAAVVSIPSGVEHCPIVFTKVSQPIIFMEISLSRIWKPSGPPPPKKRVTVKRKPTAKKTK
jgi:hypothetical protein